jgi:hypothetical protein
MSTVLGAKQVLRDTVLLCTRLYNSTTRAIVRWLRQGATGAVVLRRPSSRISTDPAFVVSGIRGDMFVDASEKSMAGDTPAIKFY